MCKELPFNCKHCSLIPPKFKQGDMPHQSCPDYCLVSKYKFIEQANKELRAELAECKAERDELRARIDGGG